MPGSQGQWVANRRWSVLLRKYGTSITFFMLWTLYIEAKEAKRNASLMTCLFPGFAVMNFGSWRQVPDNRSFLWRCTIPCTIEWTLRNIFSVLSPVVSRGFVATHNVSTFHSVLVSFSHSNAQLSTPFPHHLRKVTCSWWASVLAESVSWVAYLHIPELKRNDFRDSRLFVL